MSHENDPINYETYHTYYDKDQKKWEVTKTKQWRGHMSRYQ